MCSEHKNEAEAAKFGDESAPDSDQSQFAKRIERYGKAKQGNMNIVAYLKKERDLLPLNSWLRRNFNKLIADMSDCGNYLLFHNYYTLGEYRLVSSCTCKKHILCPFCAIRRSSKMLQAYLSKYELILNDNPNLKPYLMTLTVQNGEDLETVQNHLEQSFRDYLLKRRKAIYRKNGQCELNKIKGAFYSMEVTKKSNGWHPHLHMVCLCDPDNLPDFNAFDPKNSKLSKEWLKITGDSFIVDFRPINKHDPVKGFIEVLKYALKFSDLTPEQNFKAYKILKGRRLTGSFGLFRGVKIPESLNDDILSDMPYIEMFYVYSGNGKYAGSVQKSYNNVQLNV
jgi:plasmid rolling circle replication initiator protein Rep